MLKINKIYLNIIVIPFIYSKILSIKPIKHKGLHKVVKTLIKIIKFHDISYLMNILEFLLNAE